MTQRDDKYITRDMLTKESYEGNNFSEGNVVKYDLQNGKINIICFCSLVIKSFTFILSLLLARLFF